MPKQIVTYSGPFKADKLINQSGEFDTLVVQYAREKPTRKVPFPPSTVEVHLERAPRRVTEATRTAILNDEEAGLALLAFFQQNAKCEGLG